MSARQLTSKERRECLELIEMMREVREVADSAAAKYGAGIALDAFEAWLAVGDFDEEDEVELCNDCDDPVHEGGCPPEATP